MVSYYITTPRKQGNGKNTYYVVDVKEYYGGGTTRISTIRLDQLLPFIKAVFHGDLHEDYKRIIREEGIRGFAQCKECGYVAEDLADAERHFNEHEGERVLKETMRE